MARWAHVVGETVTVKIDGRRFSGEILRKIPATSRNDENRYDILTEEWTGVPQEIRVYQSEILP